MYPTPLQPQNPSRVRLGPVLGLVGGVLACLAFFLPFVSLFGFSENLFTFATLQDQPPPNQPLFLLPAVFALLLALCSAALLLGPPSWLSLVPFGAALLGLTVLVLLLLTLASGFPAFLGNLTNYLSLGFYASVLGFLLGCVGCVLEWAR